MIQKLLSHILNCNTHHALWLNTLSYLENCGARKIAACEHPTLVKEEMLKHAAEEFRHAHHLKRQISKISTKQLPDYTQKNLLGGSHSLHYLNRLDVRSSRYLIAQGISKTNIKIYSYILVTYAVELRAEAIYPVYDTALKQMRSKATVKNILIEEKEHLDSMKQQITNLPRGTLLSQDIIVIENAIYEKWMHRLHKIYCSDPLTQIQSYTKRGKEFHI